MRRLLFILLFPLNAFSTNFTWSTGSTNILIDNTVFGTLHGGDTVFIPFKTGGYRSFSMNGLNSGAAGTYIYIIWQGGAFITPSSSALLANTLDNCTGVYIYKFRMDDHVDAGMRLGSTGYCSWMFWDSCHFQGMPGFGPVANGSIANFGGDTTKMYHHWRFHKCYWDSLYTGTSGGIALTIGGSSGGLIATNAWWRDVIIDSCFFGDYSSASPNTSNFIRLYQSINVEIYGCQTVNLGVVTNPTGHAAQILSLASKYNIHNNHFGPNNFGNCVRDLGPCDLPIAGAAYMGRSIFANDLITNQRKYPGLETRQVDGGTLSTLSPYARSRTMAFVYNITAYNMGVGAGGNGPYETNVVDCYANDTVFVKNCVLTMCKDTTWGTVFGPFMWTAANGSITTIDTASNKLVQLFSNSGLQDSVFWKPIRNGLLFGAGVTPPSFITTDYYGNPRTLNGRTDIGAVELLDFIGPIPVGWRIVTH